MTEAELIETFLNYVALTESSMIAYISVLSGFIVLSFLAAEKLTSILAAIVLTLYTLSCGLFISRIIFIRWDFVALQKYIVQQQSAGALDIPWFGNVPTWATESVGYLVWVTTVGGYIASVLFFFVQRRVKRNDV